MTRIPGVEYLPGADVGQNGSRWQRVRCVILHEPQGGCDGIRNLGRTRHHSTPGTYNGSSCRDGRIAQFYDDEVRCTHAAGANASGPGWENSDTTGVPYSEANLRRLGEQIMHYHRVHGVPLRYFANEGGGRAGRIWVDTSGVSGFVAHRAVDYPPNRSYLHYDGPTAAEFERAVELAGGATSEPDKPPAFDLQSGDLGMDGIFYGNAFHIFYVNDKGQLMQRAEEAVGPPGFHGPLLEDCAKGAEARVKVIDPVPEPRNDAFGFAVSAMSSDLSHARVVVWTGAPRNQWVKK